MSTMGTYIPIRISKAFTAQGQPIGFRGLHLGLGIARERRVATADRICNAQRSAAQRTDRNPHAPKYDRRRRKGSKRFALLSVQWRYTAGWGNIFGQLVNALLCVRPHLCADQSQSRSWAAVGLLTVLTQPLAYSQYSRSDCCACGRAV